MGRRRRSGVEGSKLKTFRCLVRASGYTTAIDCLAPTAAAAAYVIACQGLQDDGAPWVQVTVSEWSSALGAYVEPKNVIIVAPDDPAPPGVGRVVFCGVASSRIEER
jgi:hypothetical protein